MFQQMDKQMIPFLRQFIKQHKAKHGLTDREAKAKFDRWGKPAKGGSGNC